MSGTALIVIDVQRGIVGGPMPGRDAFLSRVARLQDRARRAGVPVIHVQHEDDELRRGSEPWQIHPAVAPLADEPVIPKRECDSFFETPLASELSAVGANRLVLCGCMTEWCVATSSRRAVELGYDVTLVADGHATWDYEEKTAAQLINEVNESLRGLGAQLVEAEKVEF
jgi:nicotinamidase-related amidase